MKDDLIARLEAATGPSFALDCEINKAVGSAAWPPRAYTASIDAALTLVPKGWRFILDKRPYAEVRSDGYHAVVWLAPLAPYEKMGVWAPTPALALCIAALRARAGDE